MFEAPLLTEWTYCGDNSQRLFVRSSLHILCNFEYLARHLCCDAASRFCDLKTVENIATSVS